MTNKERFITGQTFQCGHGELKFKYVENDIGGRVELIDKYAKTGSVYHCSVEAVKTHYVVVYTHLLGSPVFRSIYFSDMKF